MLRIALSCLFIFMIPSLWALPKAPKGLNNTYTTGVSQSLAAYAKRNQGQQSSPVKKVKKRLQLLDQQIKEIKASLEKLQY